VPIFGMKVPSLVVLTNHSVLHRLSAQRTALLLLSSDELRSGAAGANVSLDFR